MVGGGGGSSGGDDWAKSRLLNSSVPSISMFLSKPIRLFITRVTKCKAIAEGKVEATVPCIFHLEQGRLLNSSVLLFPPLPSPLPNRSIYLSRALLTAKLSLKVLYIFHLEQGPRTRVAR